MRVELIYFSGCPNVAVTRELLLRCLRQCGLDPVIVDVNTDDPSTPASYLGFASPTVLVEGLDVLESVASSGAACRITLPTEADLITAIRGRDEAR
jgi:hypothetical protein